jgi:hypothetical protein
LPHIVFIRILTDKPLKILGYKIINERLSRLSIPVDFMEKYKGWYHPATAWEIEEYRRLGGM